MIYSANEIADFFLFNYPDDSTLNTQKLNKIVFLSHGWHLFYYKEPLIRESVQAWKYGVMIPSIYHRFKHFKNDKIKIEIINHNIDKQTTDFLEIIWKKYGCKDGIYLGSITTTLESPWYITWKKVMKDPFKYTLKIPNKLIKKYYKKLYGLSNKI